MASGLKIGLFGFGCVGQGLYDVLKNSKGFKADIVKIAVKDPTKKRSLPSELFTYNKYDILDDPEINLVIELIDDAKEAFNIVSYALGRGKHVVSANKKMIATHLKALYELQQRNNAAFLYEASVCGSIPIIRSLEEYFDNEQLEKVSGIFNGTTNYILSKTITEKLSYETALQQAQEKGFAESNPFSDVEAFDPKYKAVILALHAFGLFINPDQVLNIGITTLRDSDIRYAAEKGYKLKLVPTIQKLSETQLTVFVLPKFVTEESHLYKVEQEFNGVIVQGRFSGEQFLQGRGAGGHPTGAAVLSDISALSYAYRYEYKKLRQHADLQFTNDVLIQVYFRYHRLQDLERLDFESISESYSGAGGHYTVGYVSLQNLIEQRDYILERGLFLSVIGDAVHTKSGFDHKVLVRQARTLLV